MGAIQFVDFVTVTAVAVCIAGAWLIAIECWWGMRSAVRSERNARALADRYRNRMCQLAEKNLAVRALWEERDAAIAELSEREAREHALEVEVESLRARVGQGVLSP